MRMTGGFPVTSGMLRGAALLVAGKKAAKPFEAIKRQRQLPDRVSIFPVSTRRPAGSGGIRWSRSPIPHPYLTVTYCTNCP